MNHPPLPNFASNASHVSSAVSRIAAHSSAALIAERVARRLRHWEFVGNDHFDIYQREQVGEKSKEAVRVHGEQSHFFVSTSHYEPFRTFR